MKLNNSRQKIYMIGGGIASLASAVFLINDAKIRGENIHILEQNKVLGGSLDGSGNAVNGYLCRGGRMFEEKFVCLWDLLSYVPASTDSTINIREEISKFNTKYVSDSKSRLLENAKIMDVSSFGLSLRQRLNILKLTLTPESLLKNKTIKNWFTDDFFQTNFWYIWATMFAFQKWSSVAEMRRYFKRFMHLFPVFEKLGGIMRTVYNQYDSLVAPIEKYLREKGVHFDMNTKVTDIDFNIDSVKKIATVINNISNGNRKKINLGNDDYVFITNGSITENTDIGSMTRAPVLKTKKNSGSWMLWEKIAKKDPSFGNPKVFSDKIHLQKWESFTVTLKDKTFIKHMVKTYGYKPGISGLLTITDSNWLMSIVIPAQPYFANQPADTEVFWGYALFLDKKGNYVKKSCSECNGTEILEELFYHLRILDKMKPIIKKGKIICLPALMPFVDSYFMPRKMGDRPKVVIEGATNFAFIGQFTEIPNDTVFTVEYSVRSAKMAVNYFFKTNKKAPPVYVGSNNILSMINALRALNR